MSDEQQEEQRKPQVYLELYHGRSHPDEEIDESLNGGWGTEGPVLGPLDVVCTTYLSTIRLLCHRDEYGEMLPSEDCVECFMAVYDDLLYYDGVFYGDWAVFTDLDRANKDVKPVRPEDDKCKLPEHFRKLLRPSKTDLLYSFLLSFEDSWSVSHRDLAEVLWTKLKERGVDRDMVRKNLKPEDRDA